MKYKFLSIRWSPENDQALRVMAARHGVPKSTFARQVLEKLVENDKKKRGEK